MKNKKGISLVVLIITIVVMIILVGIIAINVSDVGEEAAAMKFLNDISIIETKVMMEQYNADTLDNYVLKGTRITASNPVTIGDTTYPIGTGNWYMLDSNDIKNIGVKDVSGTFVVNYSTAQVISVSGIKVYGMMYYTFDDVARAIDFVY